jgi:trans-2,3-dihydro-3-hydroxyanthranilate isomerase
MRHRYATADVFSERSLAGNPVAVVLDAEGLTTDQMQTLAIEFNYIETAFVLPPQNPAYTAEVRIFTPDREVPFAGHPNIGTAFLLARAQRARSGVTPERFVFEETAGLVRVKLLLTEDAVIGAEILSPQPLSRHTQVNSAQAAACVGLSADDVLLEAHPPQILSVGLPFLVIELATRDALRRARPDPRGFADVLPLDGAKSVYLYTRDSGSEAAICDLHSRMFTSRMVEDPATGSATAALTALLADLRGENVRLDVRQGEDMGRPCTLLTRTVGSGSSTKTYVGGRCALMFEGSFNLSHD